MKTFFSTIALIILLAVVGVVYLYFIHPSTNSLSVATIGDYKNSTYTIEGGPVTLVNGAAQTPVAPGSASTVTTTYFGNEATGDLNGDGLPDTAFILTQNSGGSGTFYYVVVALKTAAGYTGTNGVLLGDRIAPQSTQIQNGELVVNYADRAPGEPMTAQPSVGVTKYLKISGTMLADAGDGSDILQNLTLGVDSNATLGQYLIGYNGMTLYIYANDTANVSNCTGQCAQVWLPYIVPSGMQLNLQAYVTGTAGTITRADGTAQVTYNGKPLYFYAQDTNSGDTNGQGVGGVWSVVKP